MESKIAILRGRGAKNNTLVLQNLALRGPLIKYDLFKAIGGSSDRILYPTVSRRVDDLVGKEYLEAVGTRKILVGKREDESDTYGITWKGLIASLTKEAVAQDLLKVLENNPQLALPFPREIAFRIAGEIFDNRELRLIAQSMLIGLLRAIPKDLEFIEPEQLFAYILPALTEAPEIKEEFEKKDLSRLLQIPGVLGFFNKLIDDTEKMLVESLSGIREIRKILSEYQTSAPSLDERIETVD